MVQQRTAGSASADGGESDGVAWSSRGIRVGLAYLAINELIVGVWAQLAPRAFYDDFPGLGFAWVAVDGPYNEHLIRDVGGGYLAVVAVTLLALLRPRVALVQAAAVATLVARAPHLVYHIGTIDLLPTALEQTLQTISLALLVVIPVLLLWATTALQHRHGVQ